jgi:hypothetical protein
MKISFLSFVPFPLPDESPISAIQRTARANGFKSCHGLLSYLSKATSQSAYGNFLLDNSAISRALQACLPEHADRIKTNFYQSTNLLIERPNFLVKGVEISYSNLRCEGTALCTECLQEEHERFSKDIRLFSNCPFHNRAFLFRCPTCNTRIKWQTQLTHYCECGERLASPKVPNSEMTLDHYLLRLFQLGNAEKIASIQRTLWTLEHETHTTDNMVRSARRSLAKAIIRQDVESMTNAIHNCLPCSSADEIDVILTIFNTELSESIATTLRQRLMSTTPEQKASVATVTLSIETLLNYIGISRRTWYKLKYRHSYFKGIGRRAKISLKDAIDLKRTLAYDREIDQNLDQKNPNQRHKRVLSIRAVKYLTDIPEETIKIFALNTNLLGPKKCYIKQIEKGSELLFGRTNIDIFNAYYVCSQCLAREWNIPTSTINDAIRTNHIQEKKYEFTQETLIIKKNLLFLLSGILKHSQPYRAHCRKRLDVPCIRLADIDNFLTSAACAKLLSIPTSDIKIMIRERIIPCHCRGSHGQYLISKQDAVNFNNNHIRISELSKQLNIAAKKVSKFLSSAGILPISGPLVNSGQCHIYKRSNFPSTTINSLKAQLKITAPHQNMGAKQSMTLRFFAQT